MKMFEEISLVNYCYPDCIPLMNIMRLPKEEAFQMAHKLADAHPETTAFYRFAELVLLLETVGLSFRETEV